MILQLDNIHACYGQSRILKGVSMHVQDGEIVCLLGRNGMGKTTLLRSIMGLTTVTEGKIHLKGKDITSLATHKISRMGVSYIPEDKGVFHDLSVLENFKLGMVGRKGNEDGPVREVLQIFPALGDRLNQKAGSLSGGEQQMLAIGRGLIGGPDLMLIDEFSEGLQPSVIKRITKAVQEICRRGVAVLIVEQNTRLALALAGRGYVMLKGEIVHEGRCLDLSRDEEELKKFLVI